MLLSRLKRMDVNLGGILSLLIILVGTLAIAGFYIFEIIPPDSIDLIAAGGAGLIAVVASWFSNEYLAAVAKNLADKQSDQKTSNFDDDIEFENLELVALKEQVASLQSLVTQVNEEDIKKLSTALRVQVMDKASDELVHDLKRKLTDDDQFRQLRVVVRRAFETSEERLGNEVVMLRSKSNTEGVLNFV